MGIPEPQDINLNFPSWRDAQVRAIEWLHRPVYAVAKGHSASTSKDVGWLETPFEERSISVLEAPPGTGKTGLILGLIAMNPHLRFLVLCATKLEQAQYMRNMVEKEQDEVVEVKGKNNFHCILKHEDKRDECESSECNLTHVNEAPCEAGFECPMKYGSNGCTYYEQRGRAKFAQAVISNYPYGLASLNYAHGIIGKFDVIVSDEGHVLDEQLEEFVKVKLSHRQFERLFSIELPSFIDGGDIPRWKSWAEDHINDLMAYMKDRFSEVPRDEMSITQMRQYNGMQRNLNALIKIRNMDEEWIVEEDSGGVEFQPVWVKEESHKVLFSHANRHVIMSGTIPSASELGKKIGLRAVEFDFLRLPYVFPPENRQIIIRPKVSLVRNDLQNNLPALVSVIDEEIIERLREREIKILIHTKTYEITQYIKEHSQFRDIILTHRTANRNAILQEFRNSSPPRILASPSFDKAVDLPGDQCELIIIAKIPFPYLGTKVMQRRVKQSRRYYAHETLMSFIQMAGRGTRSEVDVCPTIVFDSASTRFLSQARSMIPKGIREAIREED